MQPLARLTTLAILATAVPVAAQSLTPGATLPFAARAIGDVDADGLDDYTGTLAGNHVVQSSATGLVIPYLTHVATGPGYFRVGDTNADGHDDVCWLDATATVLSGGDGSVLHAWTGAGAGYTTVYGGADFDADGFGDVALVADHHLHEVRSGRTGTVLWSLTAGGLFAPATVTIGDTDGDGHDDLCLAILATGVLHVARGPNLATTVLASGSPLFVGDLNCNGAIDLATRTSGNTITQLVDGATGAVLGQLPYVTILAPRLLPLGDVDGDGHGDLLAWQPAQALPPTPAFADLISGSTLLPLAGNPNVLLTPLGDVDGDGRAETAATIAGLPTLLEWTDPNVPFASRLRRRGASGTTSIGRRPRLTTRGSSALGKPVFLDLRGMLPNGVALLVIGPAVDVDLAGFGAPGNRLYALPDSAGLLLTGPSGLAVQSFVMPTSPALLGTAVSLQAAAADPAANPLGLVTSNAVDLTTDN